MIMFVLYHYLLLYLSPYYLNENIPSPALSTLISPYGSERIWYLLKYEKHQYDVIGLFSVSQPNLIKKLVIFKKLWVLLVAVSVKRPLYMAQIV